jgi:hypothetical protein
LAALPRPAEQFFERLDLAVDRGRLQAFGPHQVLAIIDEVYGGNAVEGNALGWRAAASCHPFPEAAEIMQVSARRYWRQVLRCQLPREFAEQVIPQDRRSQSY